MNSSPTTPNSTDTDRRADPGRRAPIRILAARTDPRAPGGPPWAWPNLTPEEAEWLDDALDEFVDTYNRIHTHTIDDVIPRCWRLHPALAQELPVQFWAWWAAHTDHKAAILTALEYYNRHLPAFQTRLTKLLGKSALNCRKGRHSNSIDPAVTAVISFNPLEPDALIGGPEPTRRILGLTTFGTR